MNDAIDALVKEITAAHGVAVDRNDPIFMLHTLNERLREENIKAQALMLNQFKEEMEAIAIDWGNDAKDKSERILNASLSASKEMMSHLLENNALNISSLIKQEIHYAILQLNLSAKNTKQAAALNLVAASLALVVSGFVVFRLLF